MPDFGIVDTHLHLWDTLRLRYDWIRGNVQLDRSYFASDYRDACENVKVDGMVFAECAVAPRDFEAEVRFVEEQAQRDPRIMGIIAQASLEKGEGVWRDLAHLSHTTPLLRGIRRVTEFEPDVEFLSRPGFVQGAKLLKSFGLSLDICVGHRQLNSVLHFLDQLGAIPVMLDHCGKPPIRTGEMEPWKSQIRSIGSYPNVMCKVSGLLSEADPTNYTAQQFTPYLDHVVDCFGFGRVVYGSDWPVCIAAGGIPRWIQLLDYAFAGVPKNELMRFYRENAISFYRLNEIPSLV